MDMMNDLTWGHVLVVLVLVLAFITRFLIYLINEDNTRPECIRNYD